jgi:hypothetical protein
MEGEMNGACRMHGGSEKCIKITVGKPQEKRPFGRPNR